MKTYLDFELSIQHEGEGYRSRVLKAPAGEASGVFNPPFTDLEVENFLLRIGGRRLVTRRIDSPEAQAAKLFGERLFRAAFPEEVRDCLRVSLDAAENQGAGLRIRLRLNEVPELADLPWEYLWDPSHRNFLALSTDTPIVRYLEVPARIRPLGVKPPIHILAMISSPVGYEPLGVEQEWSQLCEALKELEEQGLVKLERLKQPTLMALRRQLRQASYHIFHFVGHGGLDPQTQESVLVMEDQNGRARLVDGPSLSTLFRDRSTLRLAVLNACEGARATRTDPFAGTAQSLVQGSLPAAIAMQFEISDDAAITLAAEFYRAIAEGFPIDTALAEARLAIFTQGNGLEWGTPVLYLRASNGQIFDLDGLGENELMNAASNSEIEPSRITSPGPVAEDKAKDQAQNLQGAEDANRRTSPESWLRSEKWQTAAGILGMMKRIMASEQAVMPNETKWILIVATILAVLLLGITLNDGKSSDFALPVTLSIITAAGWIIYFIKRK